MIDRLKSNQKMKMILEDKGIICKENLIRIYY